MLVLATKAIPGYSTVTNDLAEADDYDKWNKLKRCKTLNVLLFLPL